jgi:hypothetical protein
MYLARLKATYREVIDKDVRGIETRIQNCQRMSKASGPGAVHRKHALCTKRSDCSEV